MGKSRVADYFEVKSLPSYRNLPAGHALRRSASYLFKIFKLLQQIH